MKLRIGIDGKHYEVDVEILQEDKPQRSFGYVPPYAPPTTVRAGPPPEPVAAPAAPAGAAVADEQRVVRSPVAGVVVRVPAQPGQAIATDDLLLVIEAMKMETHVTAARDGRIAAIRVAEGDGVKVGQVLVELD